MELLSARDYPALTTFIVGHEYVTVLSYYGTQVPALIQAVFEHVGDDKPHKPFVCVSCNRVSEDQFWELREMEIADLTLEN